MTTSIRRRFSTHQGNDSGIQSEWEISTDNAEACKIIAILPEYRFIQHSNGQYSNEWIHLPEGTTKEDIGRVVYALEAGEKDELLHLLVQIERGAERIFESIGSIKRMLESQGVAAADVVRFLVNTFLSLNDNDAFLHYIRREIGLDHLPNFISMMKGFSGD